MSAEVRERRILDQTLPIYGVVGLGHWAVYKWSPEENPDYPWFAEHRIIDDERDLRYGHDQQDHEYGSFATWQEAYDAALLWFDEDCREYEDDWAGRQ